MSIVYNTTSSTISGNGYNSTVITLTGFTNLPTSGTYELVIPDDVIEIAENVGSGFTGLTKVTFGSGCRIFRAGVFHNCPDLAEVVFTNSTDWSEKENLGGDASNPLYSINSQNGTLVHGDNYYVFVTTLNTTSNDKLERPFRDCSNLTSVQLYSVFYDLKSVLSDDGNLTVLKQIKTVVLDTVANTVVASYLLFNTTSVTSLTINNPQNIVTILANAFQNCSAKTYYLNNMTPLKKIFFESFSGSGIENVVFPNSITKIKSIAFKDCLSLTSVTIPSSVIFSPSDNGIFDDITIEPVVGNQNQFQNCPNINTVSLKNLYSFVQNNAAYFRRIGFSASQAFAAEIPSSTALAGGYTQSELVAGGYDFSLAFTIIDNVLTGITGNTITNVTIPSGVTAISVTACQNKTFIGSLSIPSTVTRILANSFIGCSNLTSLTLPGSRTSGSNSLIPLDANSFALATTPSLTRSNVNVNSLQQLRTQGYTVTQLEAAGFQNVPLTCFGENTRIMCFVDGQEQELMVQDIRNGVLVKTLGSGYKPVCMIGTNKMMNLGNDERVEERLYVCKKENYPELSEDLIITGCHSVLVDDITEEQRNKIMDKFGRIMVTEGKYRLTAAMDERAVPHNCANEFNIYHFALEHDIYVANYGVYANGLLVESCSKRYLAEIANMTML